MVVAVCRGAGCLVTYLCCVCFEGIDVEAVTLVINFDLPTDMNHRVDCESYLRRIGLTGRFGQKGIAINMVDSPRSRAMLGEIERHFGWSLFTYCLWFVYDKDIVSSD